MPVILSQPRLYVSDLFPSWRIGLDNLWRLSLPRFPSCFTLRANIFQAWDSKEKTFCSRDALSDTTDSSASCEPPWESIYKSFETCSYQNICNNMHCDGPVVCHYCTPFREMRQAIIPSHPIPSAIPVPKPKSINTKMLRSSIEWCMDRSRVSST